MKKLLFFFVATVATVLTSSDASAVLVTRNVAGDTGLGTNGNLIGAGVVIDQGAGTIDIDVEFLKAGVPFSLGFNVAGNGTILAPDSRVYTVTLKTKNSISPANMSLGFAMNGFDLSVSDPFASPIVAVDGLPSSPNPTSDKLAVVVPGNPLSGAGGFRFGGLNGGGGEIYFGETSTQTFRLAAISTANGSNQNFTLNFTANPEPATLLLGSLAMIPAGVALRRRRKAQQDVVEAA
jgi:hypothetical protein